MEKNGKNTKKVLINILKIKKSFIFEEGGGGGGRVWCYTCQNAYSHTEFNYFATEMRKKHVHIGAEKKVDDLIIAIGFGTHK